MTLNKKNFLILIVSLFAVSCSSKFGSNAAKVNEVSLNSSEKSVVFFATDSSVLTKEAKEVLDDEIIPNLKNSRVRVEGYCDERGTIAYNRKLGKRRANAVKNYLVAQGAKSSSVNVVTYGEANPVDTGHNEKAWAKNRRAVTIFVSK